MQICSNIDYLPYKCSKEFPFVDWGEDLYSPPIEMGHLHNHNCLEIGCCFQGSGVFLVENQIMPFSAKDCSIIFPGQKHIASSNKVDPSLWHFVMIDLGLFLKSLPQEMTAGVVESEGRIPDIPNVIHPFEYSHVCMLIQMIVEQLAQKKRWYRDTVKLLTLSLIYCLQSIGMVSDCKMESPKYNIIAPALNYIFGSYSEKITLAMLAKMCNMSESTFRRYFKEAMGVSPLEFVHEIRIKVSTQLLREETYSVNQIALMVGYDTLSSFNRQFKKIKKVSPSQWKQK